MTREADKRKPETIIRELRWKLREAETRLVSERTARAHLRGKLEAAESENDLLRRMLALLEKDAGSKRG